MIVIRIADLSVRLNNRYQYVELLCRDYVTNDDHVDFEVSVSDADIAEEMKNAECEATPAYAEAICLHRSIAERLWQYDAFLLHAALVEYDGNGYAFTARSGVGKTTHINLWKKCFGNKVSVINGDKPIVRLTEKGWMAYGTPWNGKEGLGANRACRMKALCFLERGLENEIASVEVSDAVMRLFPQIYLPSEASAVDKTLSLIDRFVNDVSFWHLYCNMKDEAALLSCQVMTTDKQEG